LKAISEFSHKNIHLKKALTAAVNKQQGMVNKKQAARKHQKKIWNFWCCIEKTKGMLVHPFELVSVVMIMRGTGKRS